MTGSLATLRAPTFPVSRLALGWPAPSDCARAAALPGLSAGRTTIVISHDLSLALAVDTVVVLDSGHVVEQGNPDSLRLDDGAYAGLLAAGRGGT